MGLHQEAELLSKVPMFATLEPSKLKLLAFTSESVSFEDGEILFHAGDPADCAYVITKGEVEILVGEGSSEMVAGTLKKNELVGELGILNKAPRSATLRANGRIESLRISEDMFLKLLSENPDVALNVMRQLSEKLARSHYQYERLQEKLADYQSSGPGGT